MEENIVKEIEKECNFKERILLRLFTKTFVKVYNVGKINYFKKIANKQITQKLPKNDL